MESKKGNRFISLENFCTRIEQEHITRITLINLCKAEIENYSFTLPLFMEQNLMNLQNVFVEHVVQVETSFQPLLVRQE